LLISGYSYFGRVAGHAWLPVTTDFFTPSPICRL
jgi:hypothetical protein